MGGINIYMYIRFGGARKDLTNVINAELFSLTVKSIPVINKRSGSQLETLPKKLMSPLPTQVECLDLSFHY